LTITEQQERIRAMLLRYRDALHSSTTLATADGYDSRKLGFPPEFNDALRELDRCLELMRKRGYQEAIQGVPLKTVRFHVIAWFIDVHYRQVPVFTRKATRKGWKLEPTGYKLEARRHRDAREPKAELGVYWLAGHYDWDNIHLKAITEACGELAVAA
jgi:hypothetical protein